MNKLILSLVLLLFVLTTITKGNATLNDTTGKELYIIFDLAHAVQTGNYVDVPVMASSASDSVVSLDFEIRYNNSKLTYVSVTNAIGGNIGMNANNISDTLLLTSYANVLNYYYPENKALFKIRFTSQLTSLDELDIKVNLAKIGLEERALNDWIDYDAFTKVTQWTTSSPKVKETSKIKIFPNPASEFILVESKLNASVALLDLTGKIISVNQVRANKQTIISVDKLNSGIYLLSISGKNFSETHKVTIK